MTNAFDPLFADATEKHDNIADAVLRLASTRGLESVSLRSVAKEAGVSMGQVQYYFGNTADMLLFTVQRTLGRLAVRSLELAAEYPPSEDPLSYLQITANVMVNEDPELQAVMRFLAQVESRLEKDDRVSSLVARNDPSLQQMAIDALEAGKKTGALRPNINAPLEAALYWHIVGAMSVEVSMGQTPVKRGREIVDYYLKGLRVDS